MKTPPIISIPAGPIGADAGAPIQFKVVAESAIDLCTTTITLPDSTIGFFDPTSNVFTASTTAPFAAQIRLVSFTATDCKGNRAVATVPLRTGSQAVATNRISSVQRVVFETTPVGAQYASTTISITNNGAQPLGIQSVRFDDGRSFIADGALRLPVVLAPSHELPLRVSFVPQQTGTITDRLLIATDNPSQRTISIDLQGVGGAAVFTASGQSSAQSLILPYIDRGPILTPGPVSWGSAAGCANHPPVLSVPSLLAVEVGKRIRFTIAAIDPDGDAVSLAVASLPAGAAFNPLTGVFTFVPQEACDDSAEREYVITFVAVDSFGASTSAPVRITTSAAGSGLDSTAPIVSVPQGRLTIDDSQPMHVRVVADAGDNCPVTLTRMDSSGGRFDAANGELILGAPAGSGSSMFTVRATSCLGVMSTVSVPVDVRTAAPFAISASQSVEFTPVLAGSTNGYVIVPIVNRTGLPLPITSVTLAKGTDFRIDGALRLPLVLDPGQELPVRIEFQPTRTGQFTDELLIARSDSPIPSVKVSLTGQSAN